MSVSRPRSKTSRFQLPLSMLALLTQQACSSSVACGPSEARVARVIDGDTVELSGGERVRYLMVDTPEITNGHNECYGAEASAFNRSLVEGQRVSLRYDAECTDRYGRLLSYVSVGGRELNSLIIQQGYGCLLHIAPNGAARLQEFELWQSEAKALGRGLWGACDPKPCG
jgi:micrococcal nuclease